MARNYTQEKRAHKTAAYKKDNAARKRARRKLEKAGKVKKGDGKEVHHKKGVKAGNGRKNLSVTSKSTNRKKQPPTKRKGKARGKY